MCKAIEFHSFSTVFARRLLGLRKPFFAVGDYEIIGAGRPVKLSKSGLFSLDFSSDSVYHSIPTF